MTKNLLERLLEERDWLLADGATGTNMFALGLPNGEAPDLWNLQEPDKVRQHYRSMIEASADIVLTNTFGGTRNRLKLHDAQDQAYEINKRAAELLKEEIAKSGRQIVCAGSVGPTGDLMVPLGPLTHEDAVDAFAEQMRGLKDGGADVVWIETMSAPEELTAALEAADQVGIKACCTLSFDTNGRTMMGVTPQDFVGLAHKATPGPLAFGGNCGTGASDLMAAIITMRDSKGPTDVLIAKANCGIPSFQEGKIVYSGTPELMAKYAVMARDAGARIIGGCCGTTPAHLLVMREALEANERGDCPNLEQIIAELGPLTGVLPGGDDGAAPKRGDRRGRRRREARA